MKTRIFLGLLVTVLWMSDSIGQDVNASLDEARSSYSSGDLENARFALQQALSSINQAIGQEILGMLPDEIGGMAKVEGSDDVTGTNIGFAGLFVSRDFSQDTTKTAAFEIMSDSPLLGSISALLSMSVFMASDPNQKRIKVDGYKALLTRGDDGYGKVSYELQLPFGNSLMTFNTRGIDEESSFTALLEDIPVAEIIKVAE